MVENPGKISWKEAGTLLRPIYLAQLQIWRLDIITTAERDYRRYNKTSRTKDSVDTVLVPFVLKSKKLYHTLPPNCDIVFLFN